MTQVIHHSWYNINDLRRYPFVDTADVREDLIADTSISYPAGSLTLPIRLSGACVTARSASATFTDAAGTPVAFVTVADPAPYVPYALTAVADGVAGVVVFGDAVREGAEYREAPAQADLLPNTVAPYTKAGVLSVARVAGTANMGIITLAAGPNVDIIHANTDFTGTPNYDANPELKRVIHGVALEAIVIRLLPTTTDPDAAETYAGRCTADPRFGNCDRNPVRAFNGVAPDSNGNIVIEVEGAETEIANGRLVINYPYGLIDICQDCQDDLQGEPDLCEDPEAPSSGIESMFRRLYL